MSASATGNAPTSSFSPTPISSSHSESEGGTFEQAEFSRERAMELFERHDYQTINRLFQERCERRKKR
jgi:hypothetical protein